MIKPSLHIITSKFNSLEEITNDLILGLKDYFVISEEGKNYPSSLDYLLVHYINEDITKEFIFKKFKKRILILPIDGTKIKTNIIAAINKFDLIITPSTQGKEILIKNNIFKKIIVIPNFFKEDIDEFNNYKLNIPIGSYVFYHESTLIERKNVKELIKIYLEAYSNTNKNVCLLIKDNGNFEENEEIKQYGISLQKKYKQPALILKISQFLNFNQMSYLWHRINCYVSFSSFEGFGIPLLRMAKLKKPIIVLENKYAGYNDFLNSSNSIMIKSYEIESKDKSIYTSESKWMYPDLEDGIKQLKKMKSLETIGLFEEEKFKYSFVLKEYKNAILKN